MAISMPIPYEPIAGWRDDSLETENRMQFPVSQSHATKIANMIWDGVYSVNRYTSDSYVVKIHSPEGPVKWLTRENWNEICAILEELYEDPLAALDAVPADAYEPIAEWYEMRESLVDFLKIEPDSWQAICDMEDLLTLINAQVLECKNILASIKSGS